MRCVVMDQAQLSKCLLVPVEIKYIFAYNPINKELSTSASRAKYSELFV